MIFALAYKIRVFCSGPPYGRVGGTFGMKLENYLTAEEKMEINRLKELIRTASSVKEIKKYKKQAEQLLDRVEERVKSF